MAGKYRLPKKNLEFIVNDIGAELLPYFRKEDLLKRLSHEERLQGLNVEDLLKHLSLEDRLRGLNAEERRKLKQLLENLDETH